ncbi:Peptidoglycan-binding lysin domain-containing protein [Cynara cardunculus var. scolymus]|uniref:Peptidoglycan-binding lysin domain-containing protein n=1 Tax=Cynara cardunculus var. scolymus TaxID=59895 RepID=A0A118K329_CYNCS|nr:Peptidoglycan-binding lysin domain-containing protein [Cynara cardunculus var. scolymus]
MQTQRRNTRDNFWNHKLDRGLLMESSPPSKLVSNGSSSYSMQSSCDTSPGGGGSSVGDGGLGYIEHTVTKFDTLAGVAIKYGVEVADIKKMNGLTTDLQMFARKTLQIPLPGRHPPSPIMSNEYDSQGPKAANRTSDAEVGQNVAPLKLGDSLTIETSSGVKKSSSTPSFYDAYNSNNSSNCTTTSSIWPTSMLNLTADLQASTAAIARPIFDGLPKPMSGRKNKAAID